MNIIYSLHIRYEGILHVVNVIAVMIIRRDASVMCIVCIACVIASPPVSPHDHSMDRQIYIELLCVCLVSLIVMRHMHRHDMQTDQLMLRGYVRERERSQHNETILG